MSWFWWVLSWVWWALYQILWLVWTAVWALIGLWVVLGAIFALAIWGKRIYQLGVFKGTASFVISLKNLSGKTFRFGKRLWRSAAVLDDAPAPSKTVTEYRNKVPFGYISVFHVMGAGANMLLLLGLIGIGEFHR